MKPICKLLLLVIAVILTGSACGAELMTRIKIDLVSTSSNPAGKDNSISVPSGDLRNKWLIIRVEFYPKTEDNARNVWIDDVVLSMKAVCVGQTGGRKVTFVFSGKTEFWTIPLDGRKHVATMMIPPHLLDRYLPVSGSASTVGSSTFSVQAQFLDRGGQVIGEGYYPFRGTDLRAGRQWFNQLLQQKPLVEVEGSLWPRNKTPWQYASIDDFDLIKP